MDTAVEAYIAEHTPASLLECSLAPWAELENYCRPRDIAFASAPPTPVLQNAIGPAELVIVHDALENLDTARGRELLGHLRNGLARRIWLLLSPGAGWQLADLIALGFRKDRAAPPKGFTASYTYDLSTYNHKRSWNNPRFWANPENFHKYRW